jgi:uncharacterized phage protein (TIGR02216 family)
VTRAPFPWKAAMAFGFGTLRLSSEDFWRMTPRELASAMDVYGVDSQSLDVTEFAALRARFPDSDVT